jgi:hypothetical protein
MYVRSVQKRQIIGFCLIVCTLAPEVLHASCAYSMHLVSKLQHGAQWLHGSVSRHGRRLDVNGTT